MASEASGEGDPPVLRAAESMKQDDGLAGSALQVRDHVVIDLDLLPDEPRRASLGLYDQLEQGSRKDKGERRDNGDRDEDEDDRVADEASSAGRGRESWWRAVAESLNVVDGRGERRQACANVRPSS